MVSCFVQWIYFEIGGIFCFVISDQTSKSRRTSDIITTLVNIYGSQELFVNEYRNLLADRILSSFSYDTARELRNLELLKLRFGESQLHQCEVMLKDVADSRRCNAHVVSEREKKKKEEKEKKEEEKEKKGGDATDGNQDEDEEKENVEVKIEEEVRCHQFLGH